MLEKVKEFHERLPEFTKNEEIAARLHKVVEETFRTAYYDLMTARDQKEVLKDCICSAMVDERVFEKVSLDEGIKVAEKIAEEILKLTGKDLNNFKKFGELYIKWNTVKNLEKELSKQGLDFKKTRRFNSKKE